MGGRQTASHPAVGGQSRLPATAAGVVASARKLIGATNPLSAEPGTIRGDYAVQTGRNVVHGSDAVESGAREIGSTAARKSFFVFWFVLERGGKGCV